MKLKKGSFTWNLGDTSFRRKKLLDDYSILLKELLDFNNSYENTWNDELQELFYQCLVFNTNLLEDKKCIANKQDKLARTYTSALVKLGLCNKKRKVSQIGLQYLGEIPVILDDLEKRLSIKTENIIFLRQLLKLRIYDPSNDITFNPFIFLIKILNRYDYLTKEEFKLLIQSSNGKTDYLKILDEFKKVKDGEVLLEKFIDDNYINDINIEQKNTFINSDTYNDELFKEIFKNRKTSSSVDKYKEFYEALIKYNSNNTESQLTQLISLIKDPVIKRAFRTNKLFDIHKLNRINVNKFNTISKNNKLINNSGLEFREFFLEKFILSKHEDLIDEYVDMTFRVFNLTGIINFKNDKVKINKIYAKEYFKYIDDFLNPALENDQQLIYSNISTNQILKVNNVKEVDEILYERYDITSTENVSEFINKKEIEEFNNFILSSFTKEKIIELLKAIQERNDEIIYKQVTDQATIPTIFEYILGIAWYYISEFKFNLYNSLNLTLDSAYYPLTHAAGGDGDIVINYNEPKNHNLMIEATLMDINTQKRGELEPVIRHATNLTIKSSINDTYTIFVANEVDANVVNIFRFCDLIKLESSREKGKYADSTKIVALTIGEVIRLLQENTTYSHIYNVMKNEFKITDISMINQNWRERFTNNIFN
ncbi:AlwI family type II restriction endonuclease [Clostridium botulinum]|nr:AlwI family type II restriction endonuclease [Clostridium botulinum]